LSLKETGLLQQSDVVKNLCCFFSGLALDQDAMVRFPRRIGNFAGDLPDDFHVSLQLPGLSFV
jgi:hypothetical protein